ncbi:hypothetical protein [Leclercia adecarboxylata]|uniref:hypothetical protein n=1 Tax=Leclercia adecarboxylata TaxID=83655 RepID=UPI0013CAB730|nr:hypothetical protein [Leclercia adecarboxylata]NEG94078.1 hypothetical protein [Leclercia adecarboxylata]
MKKSPNGLTTSEMLLWLKKEALEVKLSSISDDDDVHLVVYTKSSGRRVYTGSREVAIKNAYDFISADLKSYHERVRQYFSDSLTEDQQQETQSS